MLASSAAVVLSAGLSATAASASDPPGTQWTLIAVSSTGGTHTYAEIDSDGIITDGMVCDSKADGHHAYGEVQYSDDGGRTWHVAESASEYGGNNTCADLTFTVMRSYTRLRAVAWTKEGSTTIGSPGYSRVWTIG